jgi:cytoskeleton protein RodZ
VFKTGKFNMTLTPQLIQEATVSEQVATTDGVTYIGPGAQLKTAREARRLSIEDVANRLHLTRTLIAEIESDKYERRLAFTFIRGYLRSYARLVRVSPEMIVSAFDQLGLKESRLEMNSSKVPVTTWKVQENHVRWASYGIVVVLLAVILGLGAWWFSQPMEPDNGQQDLMKLLNNVSSTDKRLQVPATPAPTLGSHAGNNAPIESANAPAINQEATSEVANGSENASASSIQGTTASKSTVPGSTAVPTGE